MKRVKFTEEQIIGILNEQIAVCSCDDGSAGLGFGGMQRAHVHLLPGDVPKSGGGEVQAGSAIGEGSDDAGLGANPASALRSWRDQQARETYKGGSKSTDWTGALAMGRYAEPWGVWWNKFHPCIFTPA